MYRFLVTALAVFSLVSCSKSDNSQAEQEVSFDKFLGTWKGTREAVTESGAVFNLEECQKSIDVEFLKIQTENVIKYGDACSTEKEGLIVSVKNNTFVETESKEPVLTYTFENDNRLKVEHINYISYLNSETLQAEVDKLTAEGKTPTPEQYTELIKKHTQKIKYKYLLNRQ